MGDKEYIASLGGERDKVRLNIDLEWPLAKRFDHVPRGFKSDVIRMLIEQFCVRMEADGNLKALYLLLDNKLNPTSDLIEGREFSSGHSGS